MFSIYGEEALSLTELGTRVLDAIKSFGANEAYLKVLMESNGYAVNIAVYSNTFGAELVDVFIKCGDEAAIIIQTQGGDAAYTFMKYGLTDGFVHAVYTSNGQANRILRYADAYGQNFVDAVCIAGDQVPQAIVVYNVKAVDVLNTYGASAFEVAKQFAYSDDVYKALFNHKITPDNIHQMGDVGIRPECYVQKNILNNAKAEWVINGIDSITTAGDTYITEMKNGLYDGVLDKAYEPAVVCVALDMENYEIVGRGCSGIYMYNPSITPGITLGTDAEYVKFYQDMLEDECVDQLAAANPEKYTKEQVASIKTELGKLRERIQSTKELAKEKELYYSGTKEPTFVKTHYVENCAEVWAARDAILQGAKMDDLAFRAMSYSLDKVETGTSYSFCRNCQYTFGDLIEYGISFK